MMSWVLARTRPSWTKPETLARRPGDDGQPVALADSDAASDVIHIPAGNDSTGLEAEVQISRQQSLKVALQLTVNEEKTRICKVPQGSFDFLGYTFGGLYSPKTRKTRIGMRPSKRSIARMVEKAHALTVRITCWQETTEVGLFCMRGHSIEGDYVTIPPAKI